MRTLQLNSYHDVARWAGHFPEPFWSERVIEGDACVLKPNGDPLLILLRQALPSPLLHATYEAVAPLVRSSPRHNRGRAAGTIPVHDDPRLYIGGVPRGGHIGKKTGTRYQPVKRDGTLSRTVYARDTPSFVMGYADRSARFPYCRQTAYTAKYPDRTQAVLPTLAVLSDLFATALPARYAAQAAAARQTSPAFLLQGSVFTTLTCNRNWQTALHQDAGDLAEGFGVMLCLRAGRYTGGLYVMPAYGVAVDLQHGDVLLSDVHEWHGNTAIIGDTNHYERITIVCYYRTHMRDCGTPAEELARAKQVAHRRVYAP
jgi:hypothetical protein